MVLKDHDMPNNLPDDFPNDLATKQTSWSASMRRIGAMILRYWFLIKSSWPRILELIYWPFLQMLTWGFLQTHLATTSDYYAQAAGLLIGSVLLWDIVVRTQLGFSLSFLEEMWSRNLGHLLMSPLRPTELIAALMAVSLIRLAIGFLPVAFFAYAFFDFNIFGLGSAFILFFANLAMTSWGLALATTGVVLRYGLGAEGFVWFMVFILLPICCVYYPVSTLPEWMQYIALSLPPTYVFEGLRGILLEGVVRYDLLVRAFLLNIVVFVIGYYVFRRLLRSARVNGSLMQMGE